MKMNRKHIAIYKNKIPINDEYVDLPASERIAFVWDLTREVFSLTGEYNVESRLQRDVINFIKK